MRWHEYVSVAAAEPPSPQRDYRERIDQDADEAYFRPVNVRRLDAEGADTFAETEQRVIKAVPQLSADFW